MTNSRFLYVIYIRTTPQRLWDALTGDADFVARYWGGCRLESDWRVGAPWRLMLSDGSLGDAGEVEVFDPPKTLRLRWRNEWKPELKAEGFTTCTIELEPVGEAVKLTLVHEIEREGSKLIEAVSGGWPQILSNLKSLLETGDIVVMRDKRT